MRPEKQIMVNHIQELLEDKDFFLISYMGLTVAQQEELKAKLRECNAELQVHKNKLIQKAAADKAYSEISEIEITGGTAVVTGTGEAPEAAKVIKEFAKENEVVTFKAAYVDGTVLDAAGAKQIADLPTKDVARAMLLGVLNAAPQQLVSVLNAKAATILNVLNAYKDKKTSE